MVMWNRIVDEENIRDRIIEKLDDAARVTLRKSIGPLKIFNPLMPNMHYDLNFWMRDERLLARFVLELAAKGYPYVEVGSGLQPAGVFDAEDKDKKGNPKPPQTLKKVPEAWMEVPPDGGLPTKGRWTFDYECPLIEIKKKEPQPENAEEEDDEEFDPFNYQIEEEEDPLEDMDPESPEYHQKLLQLTYEKHEPFRKLLATQMLGWQ